MIGDHIRARAGGEWRHAIDCGDGTVLHLVDGRVRRSHRLDFAAGAAEVEVVIHRERVFLPRLVVARAFSRAADPVRANQFASSADFATWAKAGHLDERAENVTRPVPALTAIVPAAPPPVAAKASAKPAARKPAKKAAPVAKQKTARPAVKKKVAAKKPARKVAQKAVKKAPAKAGSAKKAAARRPAAKAPAKAKGRAAARRKGAKARGARR